MFAMEDMIEKITAISEEYEMPSFDPMIEEIQNSGPVMSMAKSMRETEASVDSDKDGSVLDEIGNTLSDVPFLGETLAELGDTTTDFMGTRDEGIFTDAGTLDKQNTTDKDYKGDGVFDPGVGQALNEGLGGLDMDPTSLAAQAVLPTLLGPMGSVVSLPGLNLNPLDLLKGASVLPESEY